MYHIGADIGSNHSTAGAIGAALHLRICVSCDRYLDRAPTAGYRLAQAVSEQLARRPDVDICVLQVACLSGCKHACQTMLTGREPARVGGLTPDDACFLVELAAVYCSGGEVFGMIAGRSNTQAPGAQATV